MRRHGWAVLLLGSIVSLAGFGQTCPGGICPLPADVPYEVPRLAAILPDGFIGPEWKEALHRVVTLGGEDGERFPAELYLCHDGDFLYIAVRLESLPRQTVKQLSLSVGFDNGDSVLWNKGDNFLLLPESGGQPVSTEVDHHFSGYGKRGLDDVQNAQGVGRWDATARAYTFELQIELDSGDPSDLLIVPEQPTMIQVGIEIADRRGATIYTAHGAAFLIVLLGKSA